MITDKCISPVSFLALYEDLQATASRWYEHTSIHISVFNTIVYGNKPVFFGEMT